MTTQGEFALLWQQISRLHAQLLTAWTRSGLALDPAAIEAPCQELIRVDHDRRLEWARSFDEWPPALVATLADQRAWALQKFDQFAALNDQERATHQRACLEWLAHVMAHLSFADTSDVIAGIRTASDQYLACITETRSPASTRPASEEYSAELQASVLNLSLEQLAEPILDLGCGREATLVRWLRKHNKNAIGLDLYGERSFGCLSVDWFEFPFVAGHFGSIIAHLSFSLQFLKHHLDVNGRAADYARRYMVILNALRVGGVFVYTPGLPFIERLLPEEKFKVERHPVKNLPPQARADAAYSKYLGDDPLYACHVTRLAS